MKSVEYKLILIKTKDNVIKKFFDDYFSINGSNVDDVLVYTLENDKAYEEYNLNNICVSISADVGYDVSLFESNILNKKEDIKLLIDIYNKYYIVGYMNVAKMVLSIINSEDIIKAKKIFLYSFSDDSLLSITKAMFKSNLNVSKAANIAYMHRNTAINKLDTIKYKTGLNLQCFEDSIAMYMLLK